MIKRSTSLIVMVYGLLMIGFGLMGYHKGHSLISLIAGAGSGAILFICSILMLANQKIGARGALAVTFLLTLVFVVRYVISQAVMPGILALMSGAMLLFLLVQNVSWRRK